MTMRVVLLTTNMARGGAEMQVVQLAKGLRRRQWDVSVISLLPVTAFGEELSDAGVAVSSLRMRPGTPDPVALARLVRILRRLRPQILHGHMFHANVLARLIRSICPVPVILSTAHTLIESGRYSEDPRWREWLYRLTDPLSDATAVVCEAIADRYVALKVAPRAKMPVIPNAVETGRFRPDPAVRSTVRRHLGIGSEFVWLAVGRLMWKKDYATMLRAFAKQHRGTLLIAGAGPEESKLRSLALESDADIRFLGLREDVAELMCAADAFVQSSIIEGLPASLLEAISSGLPCVATDVGGTGEIIIPERNGILVPLSDPEGLAGAMDRLMSMSVEAREAMSHVAREHALARFDQNVIVGRWERLYLELLEAALERTI